MFSPSKLKHYRLANNLSQTAIANKLDVTRATLSAWETGKTVPNRKHLQELAQLLHTHPDNLQEEHPHLTLYKQLNKTNKKSRCVKPQIKWTVKKVRCLEGMLP
ncbi:helix-turn-helix transcriptional regulator [Streptococcus ruminantium]|uniref:helix-turn-helix transcriptional regulator n=1 Tax=Streptococcus ruminantium TaxID=1917441 RepID=UPI0012DF6C28|nr:helix-turn-helix transcriptional regulator [Streptococcus ruminantium]